MTLLARSRGSHHQPLPFKIINTFSPFVFLHNCPLTIAGWRKTLLLGFWSFACVEQIWYSKRLSAYSAVTGPGVLFYEANISE
jgi:hypothetical protein